MRSTRPATLAPPQAAPAAVLMLLVVVVVAVAVLVTADVAAAEVAVEMVQRFLQVWSASAGGPSCVQRGVLRAPPLPTSATLLGTPPRTPPGGSPSSSSSSSSSPPTHGLLRMPCGRGAYPSPFLWSGGPMKTMLPAMPFARRRPQCSLHPLASPPPPRQRGKPDPPTPPFPTHAACSSLRSPSPRRPLRRC